MEKQYFSNLILNNLCKNLQVGHTPEPNFLKIIDTGYKYEKKNIGHIFKSKFSWLNKNKSEEGNQKVQKNAE